MTQAFDLLVFDWDGTLMDSQARIVACIEAAAQDLNEAVPARDAIRNIIGLGLHEAVAELFPGSDREFHLRLAGRYRHHYLDACRVSSELFVGVRDMLESLHRRRFLLGVATGKGRAGLDRVLGETGLQHLFHASRCADEAASKPSPQMLEELMEELGVTPERTVMIGDTEWDLRMAQSAGTAAVAVGYGAHEPGRLQQCQPLFCASSITELRDWLESRAG